MYGWDLERQTPLNLERVRQLSLFGILFPFRSKHTFTVKYTGMKPHHPDHQRVEVMRRDLASCWQRGPGSTMGMTSSKLPYSADLYCSLCSLYLSAE